MSCRLIVLLICGSLLVTGNVDVLRSHLDDVTKILGKSPNKCQSNFKNYACGGYRKSGPIDYPNEKVPFSVIANELESNSKFSFASSLKAKDFFYSCKNNQHPEDILKKVSLFQKNDFNFGQFLGELKTDGVDFILKTNIDLDNGKPKVSIGLQMDMFKSSVYSESNLKSGLGLLKVPRDEIEPVLKEITQFISSGKTVANGRSGSSSSDIHSLKNFEGDLYLSQLKKLPKLQGSFETTINNVENVGKVLELLSKMDKKAFKYFAALEILKLFSDFNCELTVEYFKLPIMAEFNKQYFSKEDKDNHLQILQNFISSAELINRNSPAIGRAKEKKRIIESLDNILSGTKIDAEYKDCVIVKENFFQNILNANKYKVYRFLNTEEKDSVAEGVFLNILNPTNRNKPVSYHYATQGLFLWEVFFRENSPKSKCGSLDVELNEYSEALKMSFLDFKKSKIDNIQIYTDHNLSPEETYFLNVAQKQCDNKNSQQWKVFLASKELAEILGCDVPSC